MAHRQTQTEWENEMCMQILDVIRSELYLDFRYLDMALSALTFSANEQIHTLATDGTYLFFSREQILRVFRNNPLFLDRAGSWKKSTKTAALPGKAFLLMTFKRRRLPDDISENRYIYLEKRKSWHTDKRRPSGKMKCACRFWM